jgi:iron-sulfur cluster repair protein YtfE (RIC family)
VNVVSPPPGPGDHSHAAAAWPPDEEGPDIGALILEEHGALFPHLEHLASLALESATLPEAELRSRLGEVLEFLRSGLLPHAQEEELSVYPAVEKVLRAVGGATRTMSIDHRFIGEMVDELAGVGDGDLSGPEREHARSLLYGLRAVLKIHFSKENEVYVPLLGLLSAAERRQLQARLTGGDAGHHHLPKET